MALPKQPEVEIPLLRVLAKLGGSARPADVYPELEKHFGLSEIDLAEENVSGGSKWTNRVQWVRQHLVANGELDGSQRGIWALTEKGRKRASAAPTNNESAIVDNLQAIWEQYESSFRDKILDRLLALTPTQFEHFGRELLRAYGFVDLEVTQASRDGGIDGYGRLRVGVAYMQVAFQCKRWEGSVGRPEIDKFRGAIQGEFEQGIFFTTAEFAKGAMAASIKKGAVPIILIDGEQLVRIMVEKGLGVAKRPIYLYEEMPIAGVKEAEQ